MAENSSIIVCDQRFDVGRRVITWQEDPKISAYTLHCVSHDGIYPTSPAKGLGAVAYRYRGRRLIGADRSLGRLQQIVKQFVIHHDGMGTSRDCFRVLHDERGLSVHFLLDNNGDIYQTLDLVECAFQAAGVNEISIGVELCSRGDKVEKGTYPEALYAKYKREQKTCTINGHQWLAWGYTEEQYESMMALGRALGRIFPGLPQVYPQDGSGEPLWATLAGDPREYSGYLGHYHVTNQKWDPGPWDFKRFIQSIRGRIFYPAVPGKDKAELPDDSEAAEEIAHELYDNNEKQGEGGYFPVGPLMSKGASGTRLWHGGLHLRDERGNPIVSPFAGKVVLARIKKEDDWIQVGSVNFVLIKHELTFGGNPLKFFTLLFHLDHEPAEDRWPQWMKSGKEKKWFGELQGGELVRLDQAVAAGEVVGHFGEAGKPGSWKGQVHFEIFSAEEIGALVEPGFWHTIDGSKAGRFCNIPEIATPIDANKDWILTQNEIVAFFQRSPARDKYRKMAVRHLSEWGDKGDFESMISRSRDFGAGKNRAFVHQLFEEQVKPTLWWDDNLADLGLPDDKIIWGYHPITFVVWLHDRMHGSAQAAKGVGDASAYAGKKPPSEIKDDAEATDGFMDDEDALFGEAAKNLDLEKLAEGFPD